MSNELLLEYASTDASGFVTVLREGAEVGRYPAAFGPEVQPGDYVLDQDLALAHRSFKSSTGNVVDVMVDPFGDVTLQPIGTMVCSSNELAPVLPEVTKVTVRKCWFLWHSQSYQRVQARPLPRAFNAADEFLYHSTLGYGNSGTDLNPASMLAWHEWFQGKGGEFGGAGASGSWDNVPGFPAGSRQELKSEGNGTRVNVFDTEGATLASFLVSQGADGKTALTTDAGRSLVLDPTDARNFEVFQDGTRIFSQSENGAQTHTPSFEGETGGSSAPGATLMADAGSASTAPDASASDTSTSSAGTAY